MSALGDALATKNRDFVLKCKVTIAVDSATTEASPTYSVLLEAPEMSETLLEAQSDVEVTAALAEFTAWATTEWGS